MISIKNGQVIIDGQPTTDAELIGFHLLDFAETTENDPLTIELKESDVFISVDKEDMKNKYMQFLSLNSLRVTQERLSLLDLILTMDDFDSADFVKAGLKLKVSYPTCYNFLQSCVDAKIIHLKPKLYSFSKY